MQIKYMYMNAKNRFSFLPANLGSKFSSMLKSWSSVSIVSPLNLNVLYKT